jgi:protein-S-isoprenylcysteine O-methyltransferase Ste14
VTVLPAAGNPAALGHPQLWLLACLGVLATLMQPAYNSLATGNAMPADRGTSTAVVWSIYAVSVAAVLEAVYWRYPRSLDVDAVAALAFAAMLLGLWLRSWAVVTLGSDFTWYITCRPGQPLVDRGPYRFVRHPGYAGALLTYCAGPFFLHSWLAATVALLVLPVVFLARIRVEEGLLLAEMGSRYGDYRRRVRALVPWPW